MFDNDANEKRAAQAHRWVFDDWQAGLASSRKAAEKRMRFFFKLMILLMAILYLIIMASTGGH